MGHCKSITSQGARGALFIDPQTPVLASHLSFSSLPKRSIIVPRYRERRTKLFNPALSRYPDHNPRETVILLSAAQLALGKPRRGFVLEIDMGESWHGCSVQLGDMGWDWYRYSDVPMTDRFRELRSIEVSDSVDLVPSSSSRNFMGVVTLHAWL